MLRVKQVRNYRVAKYPRATYQHPPTFAVPDLLKHSAAATVMMFLLESCDFSKPTSGLPRVDFVTETEARQVLNNVLQRNGISFKSDVVINLDLGIHGSGVLVVDAYNDSLRVGYEYLLAEDVGSFDGTVTMRLILWLVPRDHTST